MLLWLAVPVNSVFGFTAAVLRQTFPSGCQFPLPVTCSVGIIASENPGQPSDVLSSYAPLVVLKPVLNSAQLYA